MREEGSSIITELTARKVSKLMGHFPYRLDYERGDGEPVEREVMVKVKPLGAEIGLMVKSMASMCGQKLAQAYKKFQHRTGFANTHVRELGVCEIDHPAFRRHLPTTYGTYQNAEREAYVIVMERLEGMVLAGALRSVRQPHQPVRDGATPSGATRSWSTWCARCAHLIYLLRKDLR